MVENFAYIVACWYGKRRYNLGCTGTYYIEKHLELLKCNFIEGAVLPILVINSEDKTKLDDIEKTEKLLNKYRPFKNEPMIIYRRNKNLSYGAWQEAVIWIFKYRPDIKYAMLIEDDYVPVNPKFSIPFIETLKVTNGGYACQLLTHNKFKFHIAISNGMIDLYKAKEVYEKYGKIFELSDDENKNCSQNIFLKLMFSMYPVIGLNAYTHPFNQDVHTKSDDVEVVTRRCIVYGGKSGILIMPVGDEKMNAYSIACSEKTCPVKMFMEPCVFKNAQGMCTVWEDKHEK